MRRAILLLVLVNLAAALAAFGREVPWKTGRDALATLWQVEATVIGLALVLIIFALESGGLTSRFRRELTVSAGFYPAAAAGVVLILVTGEALALSDRSFGEWLALVAWLGAAAWGILFLVVIGEAVRITDPVYRVELRRGLMLRATDDTLRLELIRNVAGSLLSRAFAEAGGEASPFLLKRQDQPESARVRVGRRGQVIDFNVRAAAQAARTEAVAGAHLTIATRLWDSVETDTALAQGTRPIPEPTAHLLRDAVRVRPVMAGPNIRSHVEALRYEAQTSLGPDTSVLAAALAAYESVLERYAEGWLQYVPALEPEHITGFMRSSGIPVETVEESLFELVNAAVDVRAADALFELAYYPVRILSRALRWRAPAYFRLLRMYPVFYRALHRADDSLKERLGQRPWLHLVEGIELILPTNRPPYVAEHDESIATAAKAALRSGLLEVFRECVRDDDVETLREGLRRWQAAEDHLADDPPGPDRPRLALPLAWEIVRQSRLGKLDDPARLLRVCVADADARSMLAAIRAQFDPVQRFVDLDAWAMLDIPSHEAHFIDSDTDLMRTLLLAAAPHVDPATPLPPLLIDKPLHDRRTNFEHAAVETKRDSAELERKYEIADLGARVDRIVEAWNEGVRSFERAERDGIREAELSEVEVDEFRQSLMATLVAGHPRAWLRSSGVPTVSTPRTLTLLGRRVLEDKIFFIGREQSLGGASAIGEAYGQALLHGELGILGARLSVTRLRTYGVRVLGDRLRRAVDELAAEHDAGIALLMPRNYEVLSALQSYGAFTFDATSEEGRLGAFDGLPVLDLGNHESRWGAVIRAQMALEVLQGPGGLHSNVELVDSAMASRLAAEGSDSPGPPEETTEERLRLRVLAEVTDDLDFRVTPHHVRRVALK